MLTPAFHPSPEEVVAQLAKKLELLFTWLVTRIFRHFAGRDIGRLEPFSLRAGENS